MRRDLDRVASVYNASTVTYSLCVHLKMSAALYRYYEQRPAYPICSRLRVKRRCRFFEGVNRNRETGGSWEDGRIGSTRNLTSSPDKNGICKVHSQVYTFQGKPWNVHLN